jgi:hypothetical protein
VIVREIAHDIEPGTTEAVRGRRTLRRAILRVVDGDETPAIAVSARAVSSLVDRWVTQKGRKGGD